MRAMRSTGTRTIKASLALACTAAILAACNPTPPPVPSTTTSTSSRPTASELNQTTMRWIDSGAIDLMSAEGTFLRAAAESFRVTESGSQPGAASLDEGYPGFRHAFNASFPAESLVVGGETWVGTRFFEVQDVHTDGDRYTVHYCDYGSLVASKDLDGQYSSAGSRPAGGAWAMTFGPDPKLTAEQQISPKPHQRGPARKPAGNVFGTWVMFKQDTASVQYPQCNKLAPNTPTDWPNPYVRTDPPPTLPPDPGWPEAESK
ncbi:Uncharacterised protein [Mycobacteroides abscessus subsp. massiliense]|nr:Uncharacterised protein [Mycobacteroides abscessus subsp. massiliense]